MSKQIAITQRVQVVEQTGERRDALSQEWAVFAQACGFCPVILPNHLPTVKQILSQTPLDGILLTGGNDLSAYGGDAPERDEVEKVLIAWSIENRVPLLGVCRGMQMLLSVFGVPLQRVSGHIRVEHPLDNGDTVNSYHGWGATACPPPLYPRAWGPDGVLEAVGHRAYPWIHGIMWHPERYLPPRPRDVGWIKEVFTL